MEIEWRSIVKESIEVTPSLIFVIDINIMELFR